MGFATVSENFDFLMKGLQVTLSLSAISITLSLMFGTVLGVLRYSKLFPLNYISAAFIEITRSIPLLLYIIFVHYTFSPLLLEHVSLSAILGTSSLEFQSACIALTLFTSAYVAEIIRGGLKSIERGHIDAAKSLGLNYFQRLVYIILPLAIARMMPALVSQFISLIKDTSLASAIALIELTRAGEIIYERTHNEFEILVFVAFVYFVICFGLSVISRNFETKPFVFSRFKYLFTQN